jgi:hypothetical protein
MSLNQSATQLLRNDHRIVKGLFGQARAFRSRDRELREVAVRHLFLALDVHTQMEVKFLYSALQDNPEASALIAQSRDDHQEMTDMAQELERLDPHSDEFDNGIAELQALIEIHMVTEEKHLFPIAERVLADRLTDLGQQMAEFRQSLIASVIDKKAA